MLKSVESKVRLAYKKSWHEIINKNDFPDIRRIVRREVLGVNAVVIDSRCRLHILREARECYETSIG